MERQHHSMGTCWCGELHAREHRLDREVTKLRQAITQMMALPNDPYSRREMKRIGREALGG